MFHVYPHFPALPCIASALLLLVTGCETVSSRGYMPQTTATFPSSETVEVLQLEDAAHLKRTMRLGYQVIGLSEFRGRERSDWDVQATAQAKKVGADILMLSSKDIGLTSKNRQQPPFTQGPAATLNGQGSSLGGLPHATKTGQANSTFLNSIGTTPAPPPVKTVETYAYTAVFLRKCDRQAMRFGALYETLEDEIRTQLPNRTGVRVWVVCNRTPADAAGITDDDVILEANGKNVNDETEIADIIAAVPPGQTIPLLIWRNGQTITRTIQLP